MKDSDLLSRAAKALREQHDGQRTGSGFTRARIMRQLHQKRRRRLLTWIGFSPLFALIAGSAWAQGTGSWEKVWESVNYGLNAITHVVTFDNDVAERELEGPTVPRGRASSSPNATASPSATPEAAPVVDELPVPAMDAGLPDPPEPLHGHTRAKKPPKAPLPDKDPELLEFRAAHDAHFKGGAMWDAVDAYQRYLARFPRGRFVPEARYNVGVLQLKLGNTEQARRALLPFAQGAFGGYRQRQARALLSMLDVGGAGGASGEPRRSP